MTAITDSFETLVESALFERLGDRMGPDGVYADPFYLQIKTFVRTAGEVMPTLPQADMPFLWIEYVGGMDRGKVIGSTVGFAREVFVVYASMTFTPEILQLPSDDLDTFIQRSKANAGVFARRVRMSLLGWCPSVSCPVTGQKVMAGSPSAYGLASAYVNDLRRDFTMTLRWELELEP